MNKKIEKKIKTVSIKLKCLEAYTRDVGRGCIRIDYESMELMGVATGDVIEVSNKKRKQ